MDITVKDLINYKPAEVKTQIKYILELIEKCHNCDPRIIDEILQNLSN